MNTPRNKLQRNLNQNANNFHGLIVSDINTLRPRQDGRHLPDDTFKRIFLTENIGISIKISLKFVPKGLINNIPALVQIMAWRRPGDKPLSEPMMVRSLTHICVTRPQWVNSKPCIADLLCSDASKINFQLYQQTYIRRLSSIFLELAVF